jgi:hypothetical protein
MSRRLVTIIAVTSCLALALTLLPLLAAASSHTQSNPAQLHNPDFEGEFRAYNKIGELTVAEDWHPWYVEDGRHHRPEFKPEKVGVDSARVYHGTYAQKQFTTFSAQDGGVYQRIEGVTPGNWYTFSAWVYTWSSDHSDPNRSRAPTGKYSAVVGINPWGDCRATYRTTVWGKEALEVYDQWVQVSVVAQAWSETICVLTRGTAVWAVKHNDSYWDALTFAEVAGPEPQPTYTPYPTFTPYPTYTPQPTYTPPPASTSCPTPEPAPTCPACPTPGPGKGVCPSLDQIRAVMRDELLNREPMRWPR